MSDFLLIRTTMPTRNHADALAETLVKARLAVSVHVHGPLFSTYWWQDQVHREEEWGCEIRTHVRLRQQLEMVINEQHPYELPECFAVPVSVTDPRLIEWWETYTSSEEKNA